MRNPVICAGFVLALSIPSLIHADVSKCACDANRRETLVARECSLCEVADRDASGGEVFFVKDINPRKANRTLALPRKHWPGMHAIRDMPEPERIAFWRAAIAKAKELWKDEWGVAYNGDEVRTQCHGHVHIGKMLPEAETDTFLLISRIEEIPAPRGEGLWVHGTADDKMHVHIGEQITEPNLMR